MDWDDHKIILLFSMKNIGLNYDSELWSRMTKEMYLDFVVAWDATLALHKRAYWISYWFSFVYLEVACGIVHLSKKDEKVSMNTYMIYHALLWYDIQVMLITLSLMNMSIIE